MTQRPMLLISLPSSGSDWLKSCFLKAYPNQLRAHPTAKEFFNPVSNPEHYDQLKGSFGCELPSLYHNIARPEVDMQAAMDAWRTADITFSKENYLPWKLHHFKEIFDMVFLLRKAEHTFPPKRLRVLCWYDAIFTSMVSCGQIAGNGDHGFTLQERCVFAHALACAQIKRECDPTRMLWWHELMKMDREVLAKLVANALPHGYGPAPLVEQIIASRSTTKLDAAERNRAS